MRVRTLSWAVAITALWWIKLGTNTGAASAGPLPYPDDCNDVCGSSVDCSTGCYPDEISFENGWPITCGDFDGGVDSGECDPASVNYMCSDCNNVTVVANFEFPSDGYNWGSVEENYPDPTQVGDCNGNCGPGCNGWSICGTNPNYWELSVDEGSVSTTSEFMCFCKDDGVQTCGTMTLYEAPATWTYVGMTADGCIVHDDACRSPWWESLVTWAVEALVDWSGPWWQFAFAPRATCYDFTAFVPSSCYDAVISTWSYNLTVNSSEYDESYSDDNSVCTTSSYCGDGMCNRQACQSWQTAGDGCLEDAISCPADCYW